jgi:hypothetical protein
MGDDSTVALEALRVDEGKLKGHVNEVVRSSVEATLNGLLEAEADSICRAQRYERSPDRVDRRAGHYERKLETQAGEVTLRVPKLAPGFLSLHVCAVCVQRSDSRLLTLGSTLQCLSFTALRVAVFSSNSPVSEAGN